MFLFALCVAVFAGLVEIDTAVNKRCSDVEVETADSMMGTGRQET